MTSLNSRQHTKSLKRQGYRHQTLASYHFILFPSLKSCRIKYTSIKSRLKSHSYQQRFYSISSGMVSSSAYIIHRMHSQLTNVSNVTTDVYILSVCPSHSFSSVFCTGLCHYRTNMINSWRYTRLYYSLFSVPDFVIIAQTWSIPEGTPDSINHLYPPYSNTTHQDHYQVGMISDQGIIVDY